jgi:hypothetical protein
MKPIRFAKIKEMSPELASKLGEDINPNSLIYFSLAPRSKSIDEYTIEQLENIIANAKLEKLRHEAHVLRTRNKALYEYIIQEWIDRQNQDHEDYDHEEGE